MGEGDFDVSRVVEIFVNYNKNKDFLSNLIVAAYHRSCLFELETLLNQCEETRSAAEECQLIRAGLKEVETPLWMVEDSEYLWKKD